jgi:hypothetical protein
VGSRFARDARNRRAQFPSGIVYETKSPAQRSTNQTAIGHTPPAYSTLWKFTPAPSGLIRR